ncbi:hypothetical protein B5C34_09205 [Pacificimonas flava]|uniref:N-acetylmuramoyl-L-alanine amidase n=2 Tax=Pacificimonas TaxID=1960290 RepID=A0A219B5R3_9SPHN|nr:MULTISPECIES: N-acetylmuramoyl-L-alanine amidase [Pacificimonas]MBZ6379153.1 N-acetylmuramoyl-L-alanine amidase [Pacificimonas aurantium]OWV33621.1 hypothetical protein B5C34_09205 [Pacificimonas flava]
MPMTAVRGSLAALLAALFLLVGGPARAETLLSAKIVAEGDGAAVLLTFDGGIPDARRFALDGPRRLVIDLADTVNEAAPADGAGPIDGLRAAQFDPQTARVVLDLKSPARISDARADGGILRIAATPISAASFAESVKSGPQALRTGGTRLAAKADAPAAQKEPAKSARRAGAARSSTVAELASVNLPAKPRRVPKPHTYTGRPVIVIDAGHGGHDPGSPSVTGTPEKDVVLGVAKAIAAELNATGRVRAVLTRDDDTYLLHRARTDVARRSRAQLFISVHADSFPKDPSVSGATIYTLSETASDKEAARLAARENRTDILSGIDLGGEDEEVTSILIDLAQRETMNASAEFAAVLQREMVGAGVPFRSHFHRFAGFLVLKAPDVPAVLLETGYMSNEKDARYLMSAEGRQEIAEGVSRAVDAYLLRRLAQR